MTMAISYIALIVRKVHSSDPVMVVGISKPLRMRKEYTDTAIGFR